MAVLIPGTELLIISGIGIDSLLPQLRVASKTLVPGVDQRIQADPTGGDIDFVLPDAVSSEGITFWMKRITNGGNVVSLDAAGSDSIEDKVSGYKLSLVDEYIGVYSDGTPMWKIFSRDILSISTITATAASFVATTSFVKFDGWDGTVFDTPEKLVASTSNNRIDILEFQGPVQDGYTINVTFNFEFTNNNVVTLQFFANGALISLPVSVNALGTGKPLSITLLDNVGITALTALELHIKVENAGTITSINARMQIQRLGR